MKINLDNFMHAFFIALAIIYVPLFLLSIFMVIYLNPIVLLFILGFIGLIFAVYTYLQVKK